MSPKPSPARWWRIGAIVLACLALLPVTAYFALVQLFPPQRLAALLSEQVKAATGRDFAIRGELSIQLLPTIAVVANGLSLGNTSWGSRPAMIELRRAAFSVALLPLLDGHIRILRIDVEGADALLETDGKGRVNWQFGTAGATPQSGAAPATHSIALDRLVVADARIAYRDGASGETQALVVESLELQPRGERKNQLAATFQFAGQRWQLDGEIGAIEALAAGMDDWPFDLHLAGGGAKASAQGRLGGGPRAGQVHAALTARLDSTAAVAALGAGAAAVPLPIDLGATLTRSADALRADPLRIALAGQQIEGRLALIGGAKPRIEGQLAAPAIDLGAWLASRPAPAASAPAPRRKPALFGDDALPLPALLSLPVALELRVDSLRIPGAPELSALALQLQSEPGRLRLAPLSFGAAGGQLNGTVELALPSGGLPRLSLNLDGHGLSLPALAELARRGEQVRAGRLDLHAKLAASGSTPRGLAASANGDVLVYATGASIAGDAAALQGNFLLVLLETLMPRGASDKPLDIACAVLRLPLRQGVAHIDRSIALETDRIAVAASGELNLAAQTLALSFRQGAKKGVGLDAASLAQLVTVKGSLLDPQLGVDVKGGARGAATLGAAVATGGLSLLATGSRERADSAQACAYAAKGPPPGKARAGQR